MREYDNLHANAASFRHRDPAWRSALRSRHLWPALPCAGLSGGALRPPHPAGGGCAAGLPFALLFQLTQAFQETPHEFVTRRRIAQAKKLLLAGNHSVTDICFEVGYESLGSFSTRFHSLTGLSPAAFRSEARRTFGGFGVRWPLYYIPACFQRFFLGAP
jgi:hypothetical protein